MGNQVCCMAMTATCLACKEKRSVKDFCSDSAHYEVPGCEKSINLKQAPSSGQGRACCMAMTAACMACKQKRTVEDFCADSANRQFPGCVDGSRGQSGEREILRIF